MNGLLVMVKGLFRVSIVVTFKLFKCVNYKFSPCKILMSFNNYLYLYSGDSLWRYINFANKECDVRKFVTYRMC